MGDDNNYISKEFMREFANRLRNLRRSFVIYTEPHDQFTRRTNPRAIPAPLPIQGHSRGQPHHQLKNQPIEEESEQQFAVKSQESFIKLEEPVVNDHPKTVDQSIIDRQYYSHNSRLPSPSYEKKHLRGLPQGFQMHRGVHHGYLQGYRYDPYFSRSTENARGSQSPGGGSYDSYDVGNPSADKAEQTYSDKYDYHPYLTNTVSVYWQVKTEREVKNQQLFHRIKKDKTKPKQMKVITVRERNNKGMLEDEDTFEIFEDKDKTDKFVKIHIPIDFVLVCVKDDLRNPELQQFLKNCRDAGLENVLVRSLNDSDLCFILIHASPQALQQFARINFVVQKYRNQFFMPKIYSNRQIWHTHLTLPPDKSPITSRNPDFFLYPTGPTPSERVMIVQKALNKTHFNENTSGYAALVNKNILKSAYPIHDGGCRWTESGPLSYRQALRRYWCSIRYFYKYQPLEIVEEYLGGEVAIFFGIMGFYNRMLVPLSVVTTLLSILGFFFAVDNSSVEFCNSEIPMCPPCRGDPKSCKVRPLKVFCHAAYNTSLVDNICVLIISIVIVFWAVLTLELWKRHEFLFKLRWQMMTSVPVQSVRPQFKEKTKYKRFSPETGQLEPYLPVRIKLLRMAFSLFICGLVFAVIIICVLLISTIGITINMFIWNGDNMYLNHNILMFTAVPCACLTIIRIKVFRIFIPKICYWLTERENPQTQEDFDVSYLYKWALLSFFNVFTPLFYLAFWKPMIKLTPYDARNGVIIDTDMCHPSGCMFFLTITIFFMFVGDSTVYMIIMDYFRKPKLPQGLPQWESDYHLKESNRYFLGQNFIDLVLNYAMMTFFSMPFPIAPLWSLIDNQWKMKYMSKRLLCTGKRPVPRRGTGLGIWRGIIKYVTYLSVFVNGLLLAITGEFVEKLQYKLDHNNSLEGFIETIISEFLIEDYLPNGNFNETTCFYSGMRNPPQHPLKYEMRVTHWRQSATRMIMTVIFLHIIFGICAILSYSIPDIPYSVKEYLTYEQEQIKHLRFKKFHQKFEERGLLNINRRNR